MIFISDDIHSTFINQDIEEMKLKVINKMKEMSKNTSFLLN